MKEVKFEKDAKVNLGVMRITRKATKDGKPLGPSAGVSVTVKVEPRTEERAEELYQEFMADWKGSVEKYHLSVDVN